MGLSVELHCEVDQAIAAMSTTQARLAIGTDRALTRASQVVYNEYRRQIRRTYARPIPVDGKGRPKWQRSGDLLAGAVIEGVGPTSRTITVKGRAAQPIKNYAEGYAEKLTTLPRSKDGVNRRNDFPAMAARIVEPQVQTVFESVLHKELGLKYE